MIEAHDIIRFQEQPLFERAIFKTPFEMLGELENFACFFYIVKGEYQAIETKGSVTVGKREALVKKCGKYVTRMLSTPEESTCEVIAIYLRPEMLQAIFNYQVPSFLQTNALSKISKKPITSELINKYINNLMIYFDNPELIDEELAQLKLKELMMILMKSDYFCNIQSFLIELFSKEVTSFKQVIENNLFSQVTVEQLAYISNKSLSSFKRAFKRIYHESPARYIKKRRLEHAAELLHCTEDSISGIAYDCGFQDASTFSHIFQQKYGVSPSQYRLNQNRN